LRSVFPSENGAFSNGKTVRFDGRSAEIARADFAAQPLQVVANKNRRHNPSKSAAIQAKQKKSRDRVEKN
jgi:hypothetical protein